MALPGVRHNEGECSSACQLAIWAKPPPKNLVPDIQTDAFAIGVETDAGARTATVGELVAYLVAADDAGAMSGAELVVTGEWIGLRSHPHPEASISFGGPELPSWVDDTLRDIVQGTSARSGA